MLYSQRDATGERSVSLAKCVDEKSKICSTTHSLRSIEITNFRINHLGQSIQLKPAMGNSEHFLYVALCANIFVRFKFYELGL